MSLESCAKNGEKIVRTLKSISGGLCNLPVPVAYHKSGKVQVQKVLHKSFPGLLSASLSTWFLLLHNNIMFLGPGHEVSLLPLLIITVLVCIRKQRHEFLFERTERGKNKLHTYCSRDREQMSSKTWETWHFSLWNCITNIECRLPAIIALSPLTPVKEW